MKASDYIVQFFHDRGVNIIFGYIGGMITHLVDSIDRHPEVRFIQTYHEQTAAIAAEGYALESGKPGVAIATSGPGATNLITGIADAYFGSVPTIFITGQVNTYEYKYDKPIRQQGFQETDVIGIVKPITKYAVMVDNAKNLPYELEKAFYLANSGRKGPVLLDIPMDISRADIEPEQLKKFNPSPKEKNPEIDFTQIIKTIESAKRPLVLIGGGCRGYNNEVSHFIETYKLPFVTSLMGRGCINEDIPLYTGMIGSYGNRCANIIISKCDVLIVLGSRLDTRQTGAKLQGFMPNGTIIHVDIDSVELDHHRLSNRISVNLSVKQFIKDFQYHIKDIQISGKWIETVKSIIFKYNQEQEIERFVKNKAPYRLMETFNEVSKTNAIITSDIGQNQMWVAQTLKIKEGQHFFTSGGLAPMGFSLPAAIGAAFANPHKTIYCFTGDGGLHLACQSLLLISQYNLNIKVIILDNKSLGMITQFQRLYFNGHKVATTNQGGYLVPNFKDLAKAYFIPYQHLSALELNTHSLEKALNLQNILIDYTFPEDGIVSPKLEFNQPLYNQTPFLPDEELRSIINFLDN